MANDVCLTCHKPHPWPDGSMPRHPFNGFKKPEEQTSMTPSPHPFDPILRQALIDKGILTVQDLRDAQEKIESITLAINTAARDGG